MIEEKEKKPHQEGLVKEGKASVISSSVKKRFQIRGPKWKIKVNWKPVKKSVKKVLKDMWKGSS